MEHDASLSRRSRFAESPPLIGKTRGTYSLLGEVAVSDETTPPPVRVGLARWPLADDPVVRRALDLFLVAKRRPAAPAAAPLAALAAPGFTPTAGPTGQHDHRFSALRSPGDGPLRILTSVDSADPWVAQLRRLFVDVLGNTGERYDVVPAAAAEVGSLQRAVDLLSATLPEVARSVLSHTSLIALVDGPDAFESATDRKIPRAVFINRAALTDPVRATEALLHESVHQKLYDLQLIYQLYRPDYDAATANTVAPPWHAGQARWSFDRSLAACHVYVHLHAFFAALPRTAAATSRVDATTSAEQAAERARFLHGALAPLAPVECGPSGRALLAWLGDRLAEVPRLVTAAFASPEGTSP